MAGPGNSKRANSVRPALNIFSLLDHQTGRYLRGKHGAWYLNGGYHHIMGWAGRGNTFKTAISAYTSLAAAIRYNLEWFEFFDTEMSFSFVERMQEFMRRIPEAKGKTVQEYVLENRWNFTTLAEQLGDVWWYDLRQTAAERAKTKDSKKRLTPFKELDGSYCAVIDPWMFMIDSFTEMKITSIEKLHDKAEVGDSDLNVEAMRAGAAKSQMMGQMAITNEVGNYYISLTAHAGDEIKMDQYSPSHKKLAGLKGDLKLKGIPEKFTFAANNCYIATSTGPLLNKATKLPQFPHPDKPEVIGDTDLQIVRYEQLRGKSGPTGIVLDLVFSQAEGLLVGVTEFYYILEMCKGFGLDVKGNNQGFRLDLYPELYFTRKEIRSLLDNDPKFARAVSITAAMAYMHYNWFTMEPELKPAMADLYASIKDQGYDWNEILTDTVEFWYFDDCAKHIGKPTLTARTLLDMNIGKHVATYLKTHPTKDAVKEFVAKKAA